MTFEFAAPLAPGQAERYRRLNPALRLPILVLTDGGSLWEANAIARLLSRAAATPRSDCALQVHWKINGGQAR